jgi:hypothetical protein
MIVRAFKVVFRQKLRETILHLRHVEAGCVGNEMEIAALSLFQTMLGRKEHRHRVSESLKSTQT